MAPAKILTAPVALRVKEALARHSSPRVNSSSAPVMTQLAQAAIGVQSARLDLTGVCGLRSPGAGRKRLIAETVAPLTCGYAASRSDLLQNMDTLA